MKVCVINEGGAFGGAEIHTLQLVRCLADCGHDVHVIECGRPVMQQHSQRHSVPASVRFSSVDLSTDTNRISDVGRWMKELRRRRTAYAIFVKNYYLRGSLPFLFALRRASPHVSFIEHLEALPAPPPSQQRILGLLPRPGLWRWRDRVRRKLPAAFTDRVVAVSAKVRDRLVSDCGYPADKISVARNGVQSEAFARDVDAGAQFRAAQGLAADVCLVTILARLERAKGIDVALQALVLARAQPGTRRIHLLIAGTGSQENALKQQAESLGLSDWVTFIGFMANPKPALWASDGILFSSRLEGLPLGLLEGMAAGCLPIVTRVSGMPEVVSRSELGWVVEPEDAEGIARAISELARLDATSRDASRARVVAHIEDSFELATSQQRLIAQLGL